MFSPKLVFYFRCSRARMASVGSSMDSLVNQEAPKVVLIEDSNKALN